MPAPTITWSSRCIWTNWPPACAPCCGGPTARASRLHAARAALLAEVAADAPATETRCPACGGRLVRRGQRTRTVRTAGDAPLELTAREYALLEMLVRHPGRAYSREQLEDALYGWDREVASNAVEVHIHHLRHKLGPGWIRTLRGIGYAINPPGGVAA